MKSYCVKQKKQTECVQGSEQYVKTKNGRNALNVVLPSFVLLREQQQEQKLLKQKNVKDYY